MGMEFRQVEQPEERPEAVLLDGQPIGKVTWRRFGRGPYEWHAVMSFLDRPPLQPIGCGASREEAVRASFLNAERVLVKLLAQVRELRTKIYGG